MTTVTQQKEGALGPLKCHLDLQFILEHILITLIKIKGHNMFSILYFQMK